MAKPHVYIAGPYSTGDVGQNIHNAIKVADRIVEMGGIPFIPHTMTHLWHIVLPHEYEFWIEYDLAWLAKCDVLYRLPGESPGADREMAFAMDHYIMIATTETLPGIIAAFPRLHRRPPPIEADVTTMPKPAERRKWWLP